MGSKSVKEENHPEEKKGREKKDFSRPFLVKKSSACGTGNYSERNPNDYQRNARNYLSILRTILKM